MFENNINKNTSKLLKKSIKQQKKDRLRSVSKHKKRVDILGYQSIEQGLERVYNASISNYGASRKEFATVFKGDQTFLFLLFI